MAHKEVVQGTKVKVTPNTSVDSRTMNKRENEASKKPPVKSNVSCVCEVNEYMCTYL